MFHDIIRTICSSFLVLKKIVLLYFLEKAKPTQIPGTNECLKPKAALCLDHRLCLTLPTPRFLIPNLTVPFNKNY